MLVKVAFMMSEQVDNNDDDNDEKFRQKVVHRRLDNYAIHRVESASSFLIAAPKERISPFFTSKVFAKPN